MKLSLCTISFRHHLCSIAELTRWASAHHFQSIELWGAHAKNLADQPHYNQAWLQQQGLRCSMLSDYVQLDDSEKDCQKKVQTLCRLACHWGAKKIRIFAGQQGSAHTSKATFERMAQRIDLISEWLAAYGLTLIIETHPNTYADTVDATLQLMRTVNRHNCRLNFDVLHVWESGANVEQALNQLCFYIDHFHLKNISDPQYLSVFSPPNVYSASGTREGMVSLFSGQVDYSAFIQTVYQHSESRLTQLDASLEWFGHNCWHTLNSDRYRLQALEQSLAMAVPYITSSSSTPCLWPNNVQQSTASSLMP